MKKRTTKKRGLRGDYESRELELYITNEREVHPRLMAIETALDRKVKSGKFDKTKAPKAFRYVVDEAAKKYAKEFRVPVRNLFTVADKNAVAERLTKGYMGERGLKGLRSCGMEGCGPKSRGMKGLGLTTEKHIERAEYTLRDWKKLFKSATRKSGVYGCGGGLQYYGLLKSQLGEMRGHLNSLAREDASKARVRKLKAAYQYARQQAETYRVGINKACFPDEKFGKEPKLKIRTSRKTGYKYRDIVSANSARVSSVKLEGTRRRRKAKR
jgi:hypothetical protein